MKQQHHVTWRHIINWWCNHYLCSVQYASFEAVGHFPWLVTLISSFHADLVNPSSHFIEVLLKLDSKWRLELITPLIWQHSPVSKEILRRETLVPCLIPVERCQECFHSRTSISSIMSLSFWRSCKSLTGAPLVVFCADLHKHWILINLNWSRIEDRSRGMGVFAWYGGAKDVASFQLQRHLFRDEISAVMNSILLIQVWI